MKTILLAACFGLASAIQAFGQPSESPGSAGADRASLVASIPKTHSGPYVALALLTEDLVRKGDIQNAALAARILEVTWDRGEITFKAWAPPKWTKIDKSMDDLISPVVDAVKNHSKAPDPAGVDAAAKAFIENLKLIDMY